MATSDDTMCALTCGAHGAALGLRLPWEVDFGGGLPDCGHGVGAWARGASLTHLSDLVGRAFCCTVVCYCCSLLQYAAYGACGV